MKFQFVLMEEIPYKQLHLIFSEELARLKCVKKKKKNSSLSMNLVGICWMAEMLGSDH